MTDALQRPHLETCIDEMIAIYVKQCRLTGTAVSQRVVSDLKTSKAKGRPFGKLMLSHLGMGEGMFKSIVGMIKAWGRLDVYAEFVLSYNKPGCTGTDSLFRKTMLKGVSVMELFACGLNDNSCIAIGEVLRSNPPLSRLKLGDNHITSVGIHHLSKGLGPHNTNLVQLHLGGNPLQDHGAAALTHYALPFNTSLTSLGLREVGLTNNGLHCLADVLRDPLSPLRELNFKGNAFTMLGHLSSSIVMSQKLHQLELQNTMLTADVLRSSLHGVAFSGIRDLNLGFNPDIGNNGVVQMCEAILNTKRECKIESLSLEKVGMTDKGVTAVAQLISTIAGVKTVVLKDNPIGMSGAMELAKSLKRSGLTMLNLNQCGIGEKGSVGLADVVGESTTMTSLDFGSNFSSEMGGYAWGTALRGNTSLSRLTLTDNEIPAHVVRYISNCLTDNYTLRAFSFGGQSTSPPCSNKVPAASRTVIMRILSRNKPCRSPLPPVTLNHQPPLLGTDYCFFPVPPFAYDGKFANPITRGISWALADWLATEGGGVLRKEQDGVAQKQDASHTLKKKVKRTPLGRLAPNTLA